MTTKPSSIHKINTTLNCRRLVNWEQFNKQKSYSTPPRSLVPKQIYSVWKSDPALQCRAQRPHYEVVTLG